MKPTMIALLAVLLAACGKIPERTDFEVKNYEGDFIPVMTALGNSHAMGCGEFYTFRHKTKPDLVLVECRPYRRPPEHWLWHRGDLRVSRQEQID